MKNLSDFLVELKLGTPKTFQNLTMFPLLRDCLEEAHYMLLDQSLEEGTIEISEVSEAGRVPDIKVENRGAKPVLLLDGEELIGAKQNRILNVSVMVPPHRTVVVPVACVEVGRWHHTTATFSGAGRAHFAEGRARKTRRVNESMRGQKSRHGSQAEVWHDISVKACRMGAVSDTDASAELYHTYRSDLDAYRTAFNCLSKQTGVVFAIDGATMGVDLFDSTMALTQSFGKLVESYALDAIDLTKFGGDGKNQVEVEKFLARIGTTMAEVYPAVGDGEDYRFDGEELSGGALVIDGRMVHLCAFDVPDNDSAVFQRTQI